MALMGLPVLGSGEVLPVAGPSETVQLPGVHQVAQSEVLPVQTVPPIAPNLGGFLGMPVHDLPSLQRVGVPRVFSKTLSPSSLVAKLSIARVELQFGRNCLS